ncbi:MAG: aminotransferase class III-fold pyridoxal phosphate-dependent enzyme, partial [Alphaproteobacteria bacterium]|nr:aminotransferase class III-fold pyridoxal phosphate-dependent enzyme [Alphaproteobacteria bacterium]
VAYGKALGGGYPIGAFGGRADIMEMTNEHRIGQDDYVWMASTLGGNPISTAAAVATLEVFRKPGTYEHFHALGDYMREGMRRVLADAQEKAQVIGDGPLAQVVFSDEPVYDYRSTKKGDSARGRACMLKLFGSGIFLNPMGTKLYLSVAHDEDVCDRFFDRFASALSETKAA